VAISPILSAMADLPAKVAVASKLPAGPTTALSLAGGAFFTAALAGCWLAMDEADDPHSRPKRAIVLAVVSLGLNAFLLHQLGHW
jgi:hypothetical protein